MPKIKSLKRLAVALGYGESVDDYNGRTTTEVLKELAVKMGVAPSVGAIKGIRASEVMDYISDNYGSEEHEPYDLIITNTHASVTVKRKNKSISAGTDILYNGDKLTITATADEGFDLTTLTVNGTTIESGDAVTVNGHNITIVATGTEHVEPEPEPENNEGEEEQ